MKFKSLVDLAAGSGANSLQPVSGCQAERTKETEDAHFKACRTFENFQSDFVDSLQKAPDLAQRLQGDMALMLERVL